jgi:5-methylcytosine-specific restriction endonuclease McrA
MSLADDICVYCSTPFGTKVYYNKKVRVLYKIKEHFVPASKGGKSTKDNIVNSCQICNYIKRDLVFDSGTDAQNYILDKLLSSDWKRLI